MPNLFLRGQPTVFKQLLRHIWVTAVERLCLRLLSAALEMCKHWFGSLYAEPVSLWNVEWFMWQGSAQAPRSRDGNSLYRETHSPRGWNIVRFYLALWMTRWPERLQWSSETFKERGALKNCHKDLFFYPWSCKNLSLKFFLQPFVIPLSAEAQPRMWG